MFTGIIEAMGIITHIEEQGTNKTFQIQSTLSNQLKIDQSLSHNGVCLTIEAVNEDSYQVTAIAETLQKTNLGGYRAGDSINLERCLQMNGRLDGHMVQGHVDATATLVHNVAREGSWELEFSFPEEFSRLLIEKGSICVNGISLTAFNVAKNRFSVAIIPYTYSHTNLNKLTEGASVNIEFDMIGKYIVKFLQNK